MKKGFTLIELLAVIVILAIIALIATPIVLDIIEDSKNSSIRESVNMYKSAAENAIAVSAMNDGLEDGTYIIDNKGNLKYKNKEIKVDIKNYNFEYGILVIEQGQIKDIKLIQSEKVTTGKELNKIDKWDGKTIKEVTEDSNGIYHITKASELAWVAQKVNSGEKFAGKTISLDSSLDLGGRYDKDGNKLGTEWTPIGNSNNKFLGTFEGNNNIISGIYINKPLEESLENQNLGLFGYVDTATINNLTIKDSYIKGYDNIGILGGYIANNSNVSNIVVDNIDIVVYQKSGVIIGTADNYVKMVKLNSYNSSITGSYWRIGGVIGSILNNSELINSYSDSIIKNENTIDYLSLGGIVGHISDNSIIDNSVSEALITSNGSSIGGIAGHVQRIGIIKNSKSYTKMSGKSSLGGIVGSSSGFKKGNTLENVESYSTIEATGEFVGGIVGSYNGGNNYFTNVYSKSIITASSSVGGIIGGVGNSGLNDDTIINCSNVSSESTINGVIDINNLWGSIGSRTTIN